MLSGLLSEYVEGKPQTSLVLGVHGRVWGGPYRCYLSIHTTDKGWLGRTKIPYNPRDPISAPNGANVPFVAHKQVDHEDHFSFAAPTDGWNNVDGARHLPSPDQLGYRPVSVSGRTAQPENLRRDDDGGAHHQDGWLR